MPPFPGTAQRKVFALSLSLLLLAGVLTFPHSVSAAPKKEKEARYALLLVSVFTEEGFALPGILIIVKPKDAPKPVWRGASDRRGEYAVRLPPSPRTYEVATQSKAYESQTKTVEIHGEERMDLVLRLAPKPTRKQ